MKNQKSILWLVGPSSVAKSKAEETKKYSQASFYRSRRSATIDLFFVAAILSRRIFFHSPLFKTPMRSYFSLNTGGI